MQDPGTQGQDPVTVDPSAVSEAPGILDLLSHPLFTPIAGFAIGLALGYIAHKFAMRRVEATHTRAIERLETAHAQAIARAETAYDREHRYRLVDAYAEYFPLAFQYEDAAYAFMALELAPTADHLAQNPAAKEAKQNKSDATLTLYSAANRINLLERDEKRSALLGEHFSALQAWAKAGLPAEERKRHRRAITEASQKLRDLVTTQLGSGLPLLAGKEPTA